MFHYHNNQLIECARHAVAGLHHINSHEDVVSIHKFTRYYIAPIMFWEEKIDLIAKRHGPYGFKNPFTSWPEIIKNIEDRFIARTFDSNWEDNIKRKEELVTIEVKELDVMLSSLSNDANYWLVMMMGDYPTAKRLIYDCSTAALKDMISLSKYDFYIVEKKYGWLTYFKCNGERITLYKSGIENSPFDKRE